MAGAAQLFAIHGTDIDTGKETVLRVRKGSIQEAGEHAAKQRIEIRDIHTEVGDVFVPRGDDFVHKDAIQAWTGSAAPAADQLIQDDFSVVISVAVPLVGLIAGSIRIANRDQGGPALVAAAAIGALIWIAILYAAL